MYIISIYKLQFLFRNEYKSMCRDIKPLSLEQYENPQIFPNSRFKNILTEILTN